MALFFEFLTQQWILVAALLTVVVMLILHESRKSGPSLSPQLAINLVNAEESDLQRDTILPQTAVEWAAVGKRPIWFYLAGAALVFTVVEWWLYQRRWIS